MKVPPLVMVAGVNGLKGLNPNLKRVLVITNGQAKEPPGWQEQSGAVHMGAGRWLVPYARKEVDQ